MKKKSVYRTMALQNIRKNGSLYVPYILTFVGIIAMYYIITALHFNPTLAEMAHGMSTITMLGIAEKITAVFAAIFLFYTNSFLIKRRKKELGLYNILGMEKRHISRVLMWENITVLLLGLVAGLLIGLLFNRLAFLILLKMMDFKIPLAFRFSLKAIGYTVLLFTVITALIHINSIRQVHAANPVDLLKGGNVGEKEPKTKRVMAILGFAALGGGYFIALTTQRPIESMQNFLFAVLLVIIGTYLLFTAGSISLLKLLRKNKRYYYRADHFISVSGMIYRMKQNAVGLANICILCSAVIVTVSFTVSMRMSIETAVRSWYPYDMITALQISAYNDIEGDTEYAHTQISASDIQMLEQAVDDAMSTLDLTMGDKAKFWAISFNCEIKDGQVHFGNAAYGHVSTVGIVSLDGYHQLHGGDESLENDEILFYSASDGSPNTELTMLGTTYRIAGRPEEIPKIFGGDYFSDDSPIIVVRDDAELERIHAALAQSNNEIYQNSGGHYDDGFVYYCFYYKYFFDIAEGTKENCIALSEKFGKTLSTYAYRALDDSHTDSVGYMYGGYYSTLNENMSSSSGLLFIGIFLGLIFMTAAVLIIYYKQLTEGHEDFERYQIMQKVGLTPREIRASINSQVLTVFFLPMGLTCVHMCFAYPIMNKLFRLMMDLPENIIEHTVLIWMLICVAIFIAVYTAVYFVTSRFYYNIVTKTENRR